MWMAASRGTARKPALAQTLGAGLAAEATVSGMAPIIGRARAPAARTCGLGVPDDLVVLSTGDRSG